MTDKKSVTGEKRTLLFCGGTLKKLDKKNESSKFFGGYPHFFFLDKI